MTTDLVKRPRDRSRPPAAAAASGAAVARRVPRAQTRPVESLAGHSEGEARAGRNPYGRIDVDSSVVAKLASRAAVEVPDVGAVATRVLGLEVPGGRSTELGELPKTTATVDGSLAFVSVTISVRYPTSVRAAAQQVREQIQDRVGQMTGLSVREVDVKVPALVTDLPTPPRVR